MRSESIATGRYSPTRQDVEEIMVATPPRPERAGAVGEMSPMVTEELQPSADLKAMVFPKCVEPISVNDKPKFSNWVAIFIGTIALAISTVILAYPDGSSCSAPSDTSSSSSSSSSVSFVPNNQLPDDIETIFSMGENKCKDKNPKWANVDCIHTTTGPQAGGNVTKGYIGGKVVDVVPNTNKYWQSQMCPVNVHWHLGTEHYSVGQYDEYGSGPNGNADAPTEGPTRRLGAKDEVRGGFRCHHFDEKDTKFTTEYDWKHCIGMQVGETYEVHWPHSAAGACGTVNQYQTPFYDGVFCNLDAEAIKTLTPQIVANAVGVQAQIFTVVNDEEYFYPDLIRGWIQDGVTYGQDIAIYTGSTTGTSRDNDICSAYSPITWQVDRKCHMISASSFDKLCYDMKNQKDNMTEDLHAHGSRKLVAHSLTANNQQRQRKLHENDNHHHHHHHHHHHGHLHSHDGHDHDEWF
jgi:hypothetical protein